LRPSGGGHPGAIAARPHNRGGPGRPRSDDELRTKFRDKVSGVIPPDHIVALEAVIERFPDGCRTRGLTAPFAVLEMATDR
jgi:hypothetical protein